MGFQDRDYYRAPQYGGSRFGRMGGIGGWSITTWLIAINVAVFILDRLLAAATKEPGGPLFLWGHFSAWTTVYFPRGLAGLQVWRLLTFQFLHGDLFHLLFNMLALYFFGPMIESYLGRRRFLSFYLLCGVAGVALYLLLWLSGILIGDPAMRFVGASAGIFGILISAARIAPDTRVMLLFPPIPLRLKTLAIILLAIAAFMILTGTARAPSEAGHLGGAVMGYILIRRPQWLEVFDRLRWSRRGAANWRRRG